MKSMSLHTIVLIGIAGVFLPGTANAETATTRLTPKNLENQRFTFTVDVTRLKDATRGAYLKAKVVVKAKPGGPSLASHHSAELTVNDGTKFISSSELYPGEFKDGVSYSFTIAEGYAAKSTFGFTHLLGDFDSDYYWFSIGDFGPK